MHKGRLVRIILIILLIGMGVFLLVRNNNLQKDLQNGKITDITAKDFLPFGRGEGNIFQDIIESVAGNNETNNNQESQDKKHLTKISENIAGMAVVEIADEIAGPTGKDLNGRDTFDTISAVRYVMRENGYVYDYVPKYKKSYLISDTSVPRVSFATFSPDGNQILFQYLDSDLATEKSVLGSLGGGSVTILADNIESFSFSPAGNFVYVKLAVNGSNIVLRKKDGTESTIYSSPLSEWNVEFLGENNLVLTTKATELAKGYSYIYDLTNKTMKKFSGGEKGLTTKTSSTGNYILKAETLGSGPLLSIYNVKTGELRKLNKMGMVEKCVFSKDDTAFVCGIPRNFENKLYPDNWYLGEISTNDTIVRYTAGNLNERVYSNLVSEAGEEIDIWKIDTDNSGSVTSFINRKDMSLWLYEE